jgi:hypothetical protein
MTFLGDFAVDSTFDCKFCTVTTTGAPTALASGVISAYLDNSITQVTAGITLTADFDGVTGLNNVRVVATTANGYTAGSNVQLVITTGTVGGTSVVGYVVGQFSIQARSALRPTVAARTLDVSAGGEAGVDWANVGSPTTANALTATSIITTQKVDVETIKTNPVVNGGTITFPTTAILASTTNITAGTITTATNVTTVNGLAANVITAASMAADASAEIADAVWDEDATGHQTGGTFGQAIGDPGADTNTIFKAVVTDATGATVGVDVVDVKTQIGTAGAGLTAIDLPNQTMDITGNITGNITGSVGSVAVGGIAATSFAAGAIDAAAIALNAIGAAEIADGAIDAATFAAGAINAAAIATDAIDADALAADAVTEIWGKAIAELAQAAPSATPSVLNALALLYMAARNQITVTASTKSFTNDAGTVIFKKALSDDNTTYTEAEAVSGP